MPPRNPAQEPPKGNEDAFLALTTIGAWVNNADTKIGFLATALTVLTTAVVRQRPRVDALLGSSVSTRDVFALICLAVCTAMIILAGYWLFRALKPRLTSPRPSRFAFPHLAGADLTALEQSNPAAVRAEAWFQASMLSRIVRSKYAYFSKALGAGVGSSAAFVGWLLLVPL